MQRTASPDTSDSTIEQEIIAKGLSAPRVTTDDIEANIASEHYFTATEGVIGAMIEKAESLDEMLEEAPRAVALDLLTICVLILRNGFTVLGTSACASPENFDAEIGRKLARAKAIDQVWPLMGYELRTRLIQAQGPLTGEQQA